MHRPEPDFYVYNSTGFIRLHRSFIRDKMKSVKTKETSNVENFSFYIGYDQNEVKSKIRFHFIQGGFQLPAPWFIVFRLKLLEEAL